MRIRSGWWSPFAGDPQVEWVRSRARGSGCRVRSRGSPAFHSLIPMQSSDLSLYLALLAISTAALIGWIVAFRTEAALRRERARAEQLRQRCEEVMHTLEMERRARATEEARGLFGRGGGR